MAKKTALYDEHIKLGARMVEFAGWLMPIQYEGLRQEHDNTRKNIGLFDVSHMGEIRIKGDKALESVEWLTTNHVAKLENGQAQYSLLPNEEGGLVDDLIVYCVEKDKDYLLCVNASNKDKDLEWIQKNNKGADIIDESEYWAQIAIQGPKAMELLTRIFDDSINDISTFSFENYGYSGESLLVARTGYTGEDGCEVFVPQAVAAKLWAELVEKGKDLGAAAVGLGARDTLRTEMKYSLYGHEIDDTTNPYSAGLDWVVKPKEKDFIGKKAMLEQKETGLSHKLVGFKMVEKGIPRQGYKLISFDKKELGKVTSGTLSPTINEGIGIAYIEQASSEVGTEFLIEIRNRQLKAKVVKTPFVK